MWKKTLIILTAIVGFCSIGYAYNDMSLNAASTYSTGNNITAKLGEKGQYPNGSYGSMVKGDKVYVGTDNPYTNAPMSFILLVKETYNTYVPIFDASDNVTLDTTQPYVTGWFAMGNESIKEMPFFSRVPPIVFIQPSYYSVKKFLTTEPTSLAASELNNINRSVTNKTNEILLPRNVDFLKKMIDLAESINTSTTLSVSFICKEVVRVSSYHPKKFFIPDYFTLDSTSGSGTMTPPSGGYHLTAKDLVFPTAYYTTWAVGANTSGVNLMCYNSAGIGDYSISCTSSSCNTLRSLRLGGEFDMSNVVFATGMGTGSTYSKVKNTSPNLSVSYSNIYTATANYDKLKLRLLDDTGNHAITFNDIENRNNTTISKTVKNSTIYFDANATAGSSDGDVNTVSALFFKNNELAYYVPVATANGSDKYELDLTGIDIGEYQIALVNEGYNESTMDPAKSSALTAYQPLEIVEPHKISYTKTPPSGATLGDYEFSKNVNAGQAVGKITVNPQGVMPLAYTMESNGDNTYQNFEIDGLSSGTSSSTSLNVKIKSSAPDLVNGGLKAGIYKFCVNSKDANGDPTTATSDSKVCTSFNVEKTNLSIAFNDPSTTKKSISDAATSWNETATATPNTGTKIIYSISGGDVSLISIDPDTGAITYRGTNAFGKVKIRATVDDDPSSGYDNYNSAFVEKEIVIYREVDGSVTPDSNSSDTTIPTFTASDSNVRSGGIIGMIHGTLGTPDTIGGTTTTYRYGLKPGVGDASFFSVDPNTGVIKTTANLGVQSYHITVTVSDNWSTKEIPVTINVGVAAAENLKFYENSTSSTIITTKSAALTDTGVTVYATVRGSSNMNPVKYSIQDGSTNVIEVNQTSGAVTIHGVGTVVIVAEKQGASGQADAIAYLTFTVTAGTQNFIYTDSSGNELPKTSDKYQAISEVYAPSKTFQLYTTGNPPGSSVTYQLKAGSPTDVISVDSNGLVHVLNASISPSQIGKVIVEATSHDPTGNYSDSTIELPINITKANQTVSFAGVTYAASGSGQVTPVIIEQDISSNEGGVAVNDTTYFITIDSSIATSIAWTNDGVNIDYSYSGDNGLDIPLHVEKPGNRNYNKAEADGLLHIMGPNESSLAINRPGKIIYGDHFTIRSLQDDSSSVNVNYTFTVDNTTYISNPTVSGNKAEFDALKYSGSTNINISVTRTADGETPLSKTITVQVLPKPIEIIIDDKEKYKGEVNPTLTYQDFRSQLVSWNGVRDEIQEHDIRLSTTANTSSNAGNYPIKGDNNSLNNAYPNYSFSFKEGTLKVKEEAVKDDWYHLEEDDGNNTQYTGNWTNQNVNIISDHHEYKNMSLNQSTWKPNQVTVTKEGEINQSFWMKKDSGAITKEKKEIIKIDKTVPKVKGIKAKDTNNKLQDIINKLSGGIFFKPGTSFEITTDDSKDNLKVSGTKAISYKVYKISDGTEIKNGTLTVTNEKARITISETVGKYKVCVIPTDNAGNTNKESCHEVELKKIDVDVDKDGKPDFNDPDGDGCPDLNIKWKDPNDNNKWIIINGDSDYDGIPDLNIDSDGDGKADLNIDTDNDGKPDLNLVILKKSDWKPTKCVKADIDNGILEEYCTGTNVKAVINVDIDRDGIPDIDIDTNGDMKANLNIQPKEEGQLVLNILPIENWKPNKNYTFHKFPYDTIEWQMPLLNYDSNDDGKADINIDFDGDGIPDLNIDSDYDGIPDLNIDSDGDGISDYNIDEDGSGIPTKNIIEITEWKPEINGDKDGTIFGTMDLDSKSDEPSDSVDEPKDDKSNTSVKGQYNPAKSMGGANTGDKTHLKLYLSTMLLVGGVMGYLLYRYQKDTFQ